VRYGIDTGFLVAAELAEHPEHKAARALITKLISSGERFALAPQVLAEFIHVATDARRFERPLTTDVARNLAEQWWTAREMEAIFPNGVAMKQFLDWLQEHRLGRKRLLDTLLAATYFQAGVTSLLTLNARDFTIFGCFNCVSPVGTTEK
jgi:toxin-antitoxin system PIN domain toxin